MNSIIVKEKLVHKGAEASLFHGKWFDKEVIIKHRVPKKYRFEELDKKIRTERTINEARALIKVKKYGINVPQIYDVNLREAIIVMKFINGEKLREIIGILKPITLNKYLNKVGNFIAILHINGHIHGDITTNNIIITNHGDVFLIDFGLHEYSDKIEDKSVDLHLFKRVLISSHGEFYENCFKAFLEGYQLMYHNDLGLFQEIVQNINAIESRGRYVKSEARL